MKKDTKVKEPVAEVVEYWWYDTRPGMTGQREEKRIKFINGSYDDLPIGTKLYTREVK